MISASISFGITQAADLILDTSVDKYNYADDVAITAIFDFYNTQEMYSFEVFRQLEGFNQETEHPIFVLERVVGDTPTLHKAVDEAFKYPSDTSRWFDWRFFDVKIIVSKDGEHLRAFQYTKCEVEDYKVLTRFDPSEAWQTSQGFATIDSYEFNCSGYEPLNPSQTEGLVKKADTQSSLDLEQRYLYSNYP